METHLINVTDQHNSKLCKRFYAPYSLTHFDLLLRLNNFLFLLCFSVWIIDSYFFRYDYIFWYFSILLIRSRIFNISLDSASLNIFSSSFLHLMQILERSNVFSKRYDILGFSNFLYLPQIKQYNFFIFFIIENTLVLFYHSIHNRYKKINLYTLINCYVLTWNQ